MSTHNKIEELKAQLKAELEKPEPNIRLVGKLKRKIMTFGLGLTGRDINPF